MLGRSHGEPQRPSGCPKAHTSSEGVAMYCDRPGACLLRMHHRHHRRRFRRRRDAGALIPPHGANGVKPDHGFPVAGGGCRSGGPRKRTEGHEAVGGKRTGGAGRGRRDGHGGARAGDRPAGPRSLLLHRRGVCLRSRGGQEGEGDGKTVWSLEGFTFVIPEGLRLLKVHGPVLEDVASGSWLRLPTWGPAEA